MGTTTSMEVFLGKFQTSTMNGGRFPRGGLADSVSRLHPQQGSPSEGRDVTVAPVGGPWWRTQPQMGSVIQLHWG